MRRKNGTGAINANGYVVVTRNYKQQYRHIEIAERALGKPLPLGAQVHHVDYDESNNNSSNLVICQDQKYHRLLHRRTDAFNACGNPNFIICRHCREYDDPSAMFCEGSRSFSHASCRSKYRRDLYAQGRNS